MEMVRKEMRTRSEHQKAHNEFDTRMSILQVRFVERQTCKVIADETNAVGTLSIGLSFCI